VIREKLQPLYMFLVPIFFAVMGMLVDIRELADPKVLAFGAVYTLLGFVSKIVGCGLPTFAFGFNALGALRVGVDMVPRGEVALIIAGIGISGGFLDQKLFGIVIMMTLLTTVIPPPILKALLKRPGSGTKKAPIQEAPFVLEIPVGDPGLTEVVLETMGAELSREGFYVRFLDPESDIYIAAREDSRISLRPEGSGIVVECASRDAALARAMAHETLVSLADSFKRATQGIDADSLKRGMLDVDVDSSAGAGPGEAAALISRERIKLGLAATTKEEAIEELVALLGSLDLIADKAVATGDVIARERIGATGLERGVAFPHGRTDAVAHPIAAVGLSTKGIDFGAADGIPAKVIILLLSPKSGEEPHLRLMAGIATVLSDHERLDKIVAARTRREVEEAFRRPSH
ncbi:MAG: PTS sugar transporter subunit IIA, partial [Spirochaetaceae bacterium]|nr:PTS sugar transporter subunit IIA [Spirochaetaceae bacterium]